MKVYESNNTTSNGKITDWNRFMGAKINIKKSIKNNIFWIFNNEQWSIKKKEKVFFWDWTVFIIVNLHISNSKK